MAWPLIYNNSFKFTESTELYELRVVVQVHINGEPAVNDDLLQRSY